MIWGMLKVSDVFITNKQYLFTFYVPYQAIVIMEIISCRRKETLEGVVYIDGEFTSILFSSYS